MKIARNLALIAVPAFLLVCLALYAASRYVTPAPPKRVVMSTGAEDGIYHRVGLRYRELLAQQGIDLELRTGERLAIVGPSGSGKSTLGRLLAGIHGPRTGSVQVGGVELTRLPLPLLRRVAAVIREVRPSIVLTHSPQDYMEDHMNTCRLAVTAAFTHGMPNFHSLPPRPTYAHDVTLYHAMPHGLGDPLRRRIIPGAFGNTSSVPSAGGTSTA